MHAVPFILAVLAPTTSSVSSGAHFLTPLAPGWVISFLLLFLWLFVAAVILGPLIKRFNLEPTSSQYFSDDRSTPSRR